MVHPAGKVNGVTGKVEKEVNLVGRPADDVAAAYDQ